MINDNELIGQQEKDLITKLRSSIKSTTDTITLDAQDVKVLLKTLNTQERIINNRNKYLKELNIAHNDYLCRYESNYKTVVTACEAAKKESRKLKKDLSTITKLISTKTKG